MTGWMCSNVRVHNGEHNLCIDKTPDDTWGPKIGGVISEEHSYLRCHPKRVCVWNIKLSKKVKPLRAKNCEESGNYVKN